MHNSGNAFMGAASTQAYLESMRMACLYLLQYHSLQWLPMYRPCHCSVAHRVWVLQKGALWGLRGREPRQKRWACNELLECVLLCQSVRLT